MYLLGVFTGVYLENLKYAEAEKKLESLLSNLERVDYELSELRNFLLISSLPKESKCKLVEKSFEKVYSKLKEYYPLLPYRLEEYERGGKVSERYQEVKKAYMKASVDAWLISLELSSCNESYVPILYFYSRNCSSCVQQGVVLDEFKRYASSKGYVPLVFTVDKDLGIENVKLVVKSFEVKEAPSIIVNHTLLSGFTSLQVLKDVTKV